MSVPPPDPPLPGLDGFVKKPRASKSAKTVKVRAGQTSILIYARGNGSWVFRHRLPGGGKKSRLVERAKLADAKEEAMRIAVGIESGRVQTGSMTAGEAEGYFHAMSQLAKLGDAAPSLGVALSEYITAKQLLPPDVSLAEAVRGFLKVNPAVGGAVVPVGDVIARFLVRTGDRAKNPRYLRGLRCDLKGFAAAMPPGRGLNQIQSEEIADYLRGLGVGPRRRDNVRNELVSLFRFAKTINLLPPDRDTAPEQVERLDATHEITFYQPDQLRSFFAHVRPEWVPWLALGAFAGIRSTEIVGDPENRQRRGLRWSDFRWDKGYVVVPASVAKKVKRARRVPLRAGLLEWLLPFRHETGYLYKEGADQFWEIKRLKRLTGLHWDTNALRHSYGTHRNAELSNAGQLAEEMGTSIAMVRRHYDAVPADIEPAQYFGVVPSSINRKVIPLPTQGG